ncbi:collagen alpha-1(III) chain [Orussus abietinus]|uniref:collagen alpha-1(III) chain n=1 Tax=Orussus abietinus TaxID=222816 RepID=UPI000C715D30|nr:collagen alpha-1(III) chain [Orussus abietinus]
MCPGGSIFNQKHFVCDWWYEFICDEAPSLYSLIKSKKEVEQPSENEEGYHFPGNKDEIPRTRYQGNSAHEGNDLSLAGTGEGSADFSDSEKIINHPQTIAKRPQVENQVSENGLQLFKRNDRSEDRRSSSNDHRGPRRGPQNGIKDRPNPNYLPPQLNGDNPAVKSASSNGNEAFESAVSRAGSPGNGNFQDGSAEANRKRDKPGRRTGPQLADYLPPRDEKTVFDTPRGFSASPDEVPEQSSKPGNYPEELPRKESAANEGFGQKEVAQNEGGYGGQDQVQHPGPFGGPGHTRDQGSPRNLASSRSSFPPGNQYLGPGPNGSDKTQTGSSSVPSVPSAAPSGFGNRYLSPKALREGVHRFTLAGGNAGGQDQVQHPNSFGGPGQTSDLRGLSRNGGSSRSSFRPGNHYLGPNGSDKTQAGSSSVPSTSSSGPENRYLSPAGLGEGANGFGPQSGVNPGGHPENQGDQRIFDDGFGGKKDESSSGSEEEEGVGRKSLPKPGSDYLEPTLEDDRGFGTGQEGVGDGHRGEDDYSRFLSGFRPPEPRNYVPPRFEGSTPGGDSRRPPSAPDRTYLTPEGREGIRPVDFPRRSEHGFPGPNRELPGSNAIAGTLAPDLVLGPTTTLSPENFGKSGNDDRQDFIYPPLTVPDPGSPPTERNDQLIRPGPVTSRPVLGQGRTNIPAKVPSTSKSPIQVPRINTFYSTASSLNSGQGPSPGGRRTNFSNSPFNEGRRTEGNPRNYLPPNSSGSRSTFRMGQSSGTFGRDENYPNFKSKVGNRPKGFSVNDSVNKGKGRGSPFGHLAPASGAENTRSRGTSGNNENYPNLNINKVTGNTNDAHSVKDKNRVGQDEVLRLPGSRTIVTNINDLYFPLLTSEDDGAGSRQGPLQVVNRPAQRRYLPVL